MFVRNSSILVMLLLLFFLPVSQNLDNAYPIAVATLDSQATMDIIWSDNPTQGFSPPNNIPESSDNVFYDQEVGQAPSPCGFDLKRTGIHCEVYVDSTSIPYPSDPALDTVLAQFDNWVFINDTTTFGDPGVSKTGIMIQTIDGPYGVGGYYVYSGGNQIYVDCADLSWGLDILAHEFEHLIHDHIKGGDVEWMKEGCAAYAQQVCNPSSPVLKTYVFQFGKNPGQDLTNWLSTMSHYGSSYVFVRYLAEHYGGNSTMRKYVASSLSGQSGINDVLTPYGKTFRDIFPNWTMANYLNDNKTATGEYGYNGLKIKMVCQGNYTYPYSGSGTITTWAAEYHHITSSSNVDIVVSFTGGINTVTGLVAAIGKTGKPNVVYKLALDASGKASIVVFGLGNNYSSILLDAAGLDAGGGFSWSVSKFVSVPDFPLAVIVLIMTMVVLLIARPIIDKT